MMPRWKFWLYGIAGGLAIIAGALVVAFVARETLLSFVL
jgi:hypothetical protein